MTSLVSGLFTAIQFVRFDLASPMPTWALATKNHFALSNIWRLVAIASVCVRLVVLKNVTIDRMVSVIREAYNEGKPSKQMLFAGSCSMMWRIQLPDREVYLNSGRMLAW